MIRPLQRLLALFKSDHFDRDLDAEMASHLELAIEENIQRGLPPDEARRQALVRFGGLTQAKEQHRDARSLPWLEVLFQDVRFTLRMLRRDGAFTIIAALVLALGIGANVVVFSVVNTILLRPLPFPEPQSLVWLAPAESKCGFSCETYSADAFDQFRAQNRSFQDVAGYFAFSSSENLRLRSHGEPLPATGLAVTSNFFQTLGVEPVLGRLFSTDEAQQGARPVALLSNTFWRKKYAADPAIVGQAIDIDGSPVTVIGVLPESFDFGAVFSPGAKVDLFTPALLDDMRSWGNILALTGRLKPGVSLQQAQADANLVTPQLYFSFKSPGSLGAYKKTPMQLRTLKDFVSGKLRRSLLVLWCAVGAILLIVCVNLSNLLLARATSRGKEFAIRSALGAGRLRIIRQLLTESLMLTGIGTLLGLALAFAATHFVAHQGSIALPLLSSVRVDIAALAWTLVVAISVSLLFGIVPGLRISAGNVQEGLKNSGQGMSEGRKHERLRSLLVISEVALSCVLLVGAGLLLRSFLHVLDIDLGFEPSHAAAIKLDFDDGGSDDRRAVIFQQIIQRASAIPGIEAAGIVDYLPLERNRSWGPTALKGKTYRPGELPGTFAYVITPGYLNAMGMRLHGRDFTWQDGSHSEPVVILNETAAHFLLPGEDIVGRMVNVGNTDRRVIGVIKDVHGANVEGQPGWQAYFSAAQASPAGAQLVVRTKLSPDLLGTSVLSALRELNPNQTSAEFRTVQQIVDRSVSPRRFFVLLVITFAAFGLVLAALGIYGVISYSVAQRRQEIGIRMALGATAARVQVGILSKTLRMTLVGIGAGTVVSLIAAKGIAALLFGTESTDPATYVGMTMLLGTVAILAGFVPARRASRIDPMIALRNN